MLLLLLIYSYAADTHISMTSLGVHTFSIGRSQDACVSFSHCNLAVLTRRPYAERDTVMTNPSVRLSDCL